MKNIILILLLVVTFSGCRLVKKNQTKQSDTTTQIVENQSDKSIQLNETTKTDSDSKKTSVNESEAEETETTIEESFDKEGNLTNRKTTTKRGSSKAKTQSQESLKESAITQSDLNFTLSEVLKTFGQQHSTSESKVKESKSTNVMWHFGAALVIAILYLVIIGFIKKRFRKS